MGRWRKGGELARKAEVESCHAAGPEGCFEGARPVISSLSTHAHKHSARNALRHKLFANSVFKSCSFFKQGK